VKKKSDSNDQAEDNTISSITSEHRHHLINYACNTNEDDERTPILAPTQVRRSSYTNPLQRRKSDAHTLPHYPIVDYTQQFTEQKSNSSSKRGSVGSACTGYIVSQTSALRTRITTLAGGQPTSVEQTGNF
jgi:hypothetical protein